MIEYIHSTAVIVQNQDIALDFYVNKLGWEKRLDNDMGGMRFLTVAPKGAQTELVLGSPAMYGDQQGVGNGISLISDDVDQTYQDLKAKGVQLRQEAPEMMPWGAKGFNFSDPDGNEFFVSGAV